VKTPLAVTSRRQRDGMLINIARFWRVHVEPCPACLDHPETRYPED
jgi:hypothetical protein